MVGRAAVNFVSGGKNGAYFFDGDKYVRIEWTPGQYGDHITFGPTEFAKEWKSLREAKFSRIDAILPIPGHENRAYFFSGSQYARVQFTPGDGSKEETLGGVRSIRDNWVSLAKVGWDHLDAAMLVPGETNQAYFFSGNEYCRVSFKEGVAKSDELLEGPNLIRHHWPRLGLSQVDTTLPDPKAAEKVYGFSGSEAWRVKLIPGGGVDVLNGPTKASEYWQSLHKAGFY
ncbi:hemopexin domain protein [Ceratobasidium sp. AG-Ba]|nr:hemopexin domain protein [Ceratobasidium sp. AG-Ba]